MMQLAALAITALAIMAGGIWMAWREVKTMKSAVHAGWRAALLEWNNVKSHLNRPELHMAQIVACVDSCLEQRYEAVKQEVQAEWASMKTHLQKKPADFMWVVESRLEQATKKLGYMESRLMEFDFSGVEVGRQVTHAMVEFTFGAGKGGIFWWKRKLVEIQAAWARGAKKRI